MKTTLLIEQLIYYDIWTTNKKSNLVMQKFIDFQMLQINVGADDP